MVTVKNPKITHLIVTAIVFGFLALFLDYAGRESYSTMGCAAIAFYCYCLLQDKENNNKQTGSQL